VISSNNDVIYESGPFNPLTGVFNFLINDMSFILGDILVIEAKYVGTFGGIINDLTCSIHLNSINYQTWYENALGPSGSTLYPHSSQYEFYNGELPGTIIKISNGELNDDNQFKYPSTLEINYDITFYKSSITELNDFLNINTSPNQGEIYLYYDTGSFLNYQDAGLTPAIRPR
jgi:hypothetical protein